MNFSDLLPKYCPFRIVENITRALLQNTIQRPPPTGSPLASSLINSCF